MRDFGNIDRALHELTTTPDSLIRLAFRARNKLGVQSISQLRRAVGNVSRQRIYRVLSPAEIKELHPRRHHASCLHGDCWCRPGSDGT